MNRLPTRINLERDGVLCILHNLVCYLCRGESEDSNYLFGGFLISGIWWIHTFTWLHIVIPIESLSPIDHIQALEVSVKARLKVDSGWIFGLAICWAN